MAVITISRQAGSRGARIALEPTVPAIGNPPTEWHGACCHGSPGTKVPPQGDQVR